MTLPVQGGNSGTWGTDLNADLLLGHTDGTSGLQHKNPIIAAEYGIVADGGDKGATLNTLIAQVSTAGGGSIIMPPNTVLTSVTIDIKTGVHLWGSGPQISSGIRTIAGAQCDVVAFHKSTNGTTDPNCFFAGLWNLFLHGCGFDSTATRLPTDYFNGITAVTNPLTTVASGDVGGFDPTNIICNVHVKACTGHGYYSQGRSGNRLIGVISTDHDGHGFVSSPDTEFVACHSAFNGMNGFYCTHSSNRFSACKSYNNGTDPAWTTGQNWAKGYQTVYNNDGNLYVSQNALTADAVAPPSDPTNWVVVDTYYGNSQSGYVISFNGDAETCFTGCDAQQNRGHGFYVQTCSGVNINGSVRQINTDPAGSGNFSTNPNNYACVVLDGASGNLVNVTSGIQGPAGYILRSINGSTRNVILAAGDTTAAAFMSADSTSIVGSGNYALWNGQIQNSSGAVGSGTQLLSANDASFETSVAGWAVGGNCTIAQSAATALDGTHAMSLTSVAAGEMWADLQTADRVPVIAGQVYSFMASFKSASVARSCSIWAEFRNVGGSVVTGGSVQGTSVTDSTTGWVQSTLTMAAPATAVTVSIEPDVLTTAGASEVHYVDCVGFFVGNTQYWQNHLVVG